MSSDRGKRRWPRRSHAHRRHGAGRPNPLVRAARLARPSRHRGSRWRTERLPLLAFAAGAIGLSAVRRRLGVHPAVTLPLVSAAPVAVALAVPRGRLRKVAAGAAYMWVFKVTWELPYDRPQRLDKRLQIDFPIRVDSVIGAGTPPTLRLQRALRDPPGVNAVDRVVTAAYASWFVPHLVLGWVLVRHEEFIPRAGARLAAAYHLTTPFYWLVPSAPPWWASEHEGRMGGEVERVRRHVVDALLKRPRREREDPSKQGNPWGSMPSDHVASAAITAMGLAEVGPVYGALGWAYVAIAGFSVVYLGEHYVIDVIAGLAVAEAIRRAEPAVNPLVRRLSRELERLAP